MNFMFNKFHAVIRKLFESKFDELDSYGLEADVTEIEHKSYDGFIPYTNGGLSLMVMNNLSNVELGESLPKPINSNIQEAIDYSLECALSDFISDNLEELKSIFSTDDKDALKEQVSYHTLYENDHGELAESLSEMESSALTEGGTFWLVLRASYFDKNNHQNESGENEIYFHAGINTDYDYGRDKGLEITFEKTVKVADLESEKVNLIELIDEMTNSLKA